MKSSSDPLPPSVDPGVAIDAAARQRKFQFLGLAAIVLLAGAAFAGWWFLIRDNSPASVVSAEQQEARDEAIAEATAGETDDAPAEANNAETEESLPTDDAEESTVDPVGVGLDGTWTIDTSIGNFIDFSSTFAGFRIQEELASIGAKTVVGRTPDVRGELQIEGTTIVTTDILIDMTTLTTDSSNRDGQLRRQAVETDTFPEASFSLAVPIDLGELPDDGTTVTVTATGDLSIHGVTNRVEFPLTAELNRGIIVVVGQLNLLLTDYDIEQPRSAAVLSVEDNADLELQLFFTQ